LINGDFSSNSLLFVAPHELGHLFLLNQSDPSHPDPSQVHHHSKSWNNMHSPTSTSNLENSSKRFTKHQENVIKNSPLYSP